VVGRSAANLLSGLVVALALAAWAAPAAVGAPRELKLFCANTESGLMRYAASPAGCDASTEEAVRLPRQAPVFACVTVKLHFAHGTRIVIPVGTMWRVPAQLFCTILGQRTVTLGGRSRIYVCAAKRGGLLRLVKRAGRCHARELEFVVPSIPTKKHRKAPRGKPVGKPLGEEPEGKQPVANPQTLATNEGVPLAILLTGASSPPGKPLTYAIVSAPAHGALSGTPPNVTYTPTAGYSGSDQFSFTVTQVQGKRTSAPATVAIEVRHIDRAPVLTVPVEQTTEENVGLAFSVAHASAISVADSDAEGGVERLALTVAHGTLTPGTTGGLASHSGDGTEKLTLEGTIAALDLALEGMTYTPAHNYLGPDTLTLEADDLGHTGLEGPKTATGTVAIAVTPVVYDTAVNDSYAVTENQVLTETAPGGLLANDTETGGFTLKVKEVVKQPAHGVVVVEPDGSFTYTPNHLFSGSDSFTYKDNDGNTDSGEATVTITVNPVVFDTAVNDSYSVNENAALNVVAAQGVLKNDTDSESLTLTAELVKGPEHGALTLKADGSFEYTPTANFSGTDTFTYRDNDGNTQSNTATVTLTVERVDRAPVNTLPGSQTVNNGEALVFSAAKADAVSVSDEDSEGGVEQVKLTAAHGALAPGTTTGLTSHTGEGTGALTLEGTIAALDGALEGLTYTAAAHYGGPDTLTVETDDLGHTGVGGPKTATGSVPVTVVHVNEAPTSSLPAAQEVTENTSSAKTSLPFSVAGADPLSVGDTDAEGGAELVKLSVAHGTLTPGSTAGLTVTGSGTEALTLEGTIAALNGGLEGLTYTPALNYSGADTLSLEINDNGNTGSGGAKTFNGSVPITVVHPNPVPTNPTYSGAIGNTELSVGVAVSGTPHVEQAGSVLPKPAEEPDGSALSVTAETIATTQGGSVSMKEDGTFTYQPPVGFENGSDTFSYQESDSRGGKATGTATIKVEAARVWYVNDNLGSNGDGESNSPFNVLSAVSGGASPTGSGDVIFLYGGGGAYAGGVELKAGQTLDGQDEGLTVEGDPLVSASGGNPTIADGSGAGITLAEGDVVKGVTVNGTSGAGITATNVNAFSLDSKVAIEKAAGDGLEVNGGNGTITDEATISTSSAHSLQVEKRTGGTLTASGPVTDTGTGVLLGSNTGATIDLTGRLSLTTTTHGAFSATGGGTVAATSSENTAVTTTGVAVNVQNTTIGASGLKFRSVSANGAPAGIDLQSTGASGGLTVTGTGTASSGGEIAGATNAGVVLDSTSAPSLSWMHIHDAANFGLSGETVSGLTLAHDTIDGTNGKSDPSAGASLAMTQLTGAATISSSTITGGFHDDVRIEDSSGTLSPLTLEGDTIAQTNAESSGNDAMLLKSSGTATVNPTISDTHFTAARNDLLFLDVTAKSSSTLTMNSAGPNNSVFSNSNTGIVSGGGGVVLSAGGPSSAAATLKYDIENATFQGALGNAVSIGSATGTNTVVGKFLDNTIGVSGVANSGSKQGTDLSIAGIQHGTVTTAVEGNQLYQYANKGLALTTASEEKSGAPYMTLNATVKNNTIAQPIAAEALNGVEVIAGTGEAGTASSVCLNMSGNALSGSGVTANGGFDVFLEVPFEGNDSIQLQGYPGAANSEGEIEAFVKGTNAVETVGAFNNTGTIQKAASSCPTPP
jgi:VCBS repeat-containing protein